MNVKKTSLQWNWRQFFSLSIIAFALFFSWLYPPTRTLWDRLDLVVFKNLNGALKSSPFLQNLIAVLVKRSADVFFDLIMIVVTFGYALKKRGKRAERLIKILFMVLFILLIIQILNHLLIKVGLHLHYRKSPSLVVDDSLWLSKVFNNPLIRDHSSNSFPGDHALSFLLWASMMWGLFGKSVGRIAWFFAILFCLPRLFSGAHWFTDDLIGSGSLTLLANAIAFGLPVAQLFTNSMLKLLKRK